VKARLSGVVGWVWRDMRRARGALRRVGSGVAIAVASMLVGVVAPGYAAAAVIQTPVAAQSQAVDDTNGVTVTTVGSGLSLSVVSATTASGNVLANDLGLASDPSSITSVSDAKSPGGVTPDTNGVIVIDSGYGTLILHAQAFGHAAAGDYGYSLDKGVVPPCSAAPVDDIFTYTLTDGYSDSTTATLDITLTCSPDQQSTSLVAAPQLSLFAPRTSAGLGVVSATLTSGGSPVVGQPISFSVGAWHLCTATTNSHGVARCSLTLVSELRVLLANHYAATFAGDAAYLAASNSTPAIVL